MALATRVFDGVARATHWKAVCQAVWLAWHAFTPRVEIGSIPAPENVENPMYCHAFHSFSALKKHGIPITVPDLAGPGGRVFLCFPMILTTPKFSESWRLYLLTGTSVLTLPSRAHPQDDVRRQATPSN